MEQLVIAKISNDDVKLLKMALMTPPPYCFITMLAKVDMTKSGDGRIHAVDANGNEIFTAMLFTGNNMSHVYHNSIKIGEREFDQATKMTTLRIPHQNRTRLIQRRNKEIQEGGLMFTFVDSMGVEVATCSRQSAAMAEINLQQTLHVNERKLLLVEAISISMFVLRIGSMCPKVQLSANATWNSLPPLTCTPGNLNYLKILPTDYMILQAVGHSNLHKLTFMNVMNQITGKVYLSLEIAPGAKDRGFFKIKARSNRGQVIFTAINFPNGGVLVVYGPNGKLLSYLKKKSIRDRTHAQRLRMETSKDLKFDSLDFHIFNRRQRAYTISNRRQEVRIFKWPVHVVDVMSYEIAFVISYAAKLYSDHYELEKRPLPEINYMYEPQSDQCNFLFTGDGK